VPGAFKVEVDVTLGHEKAAFFFHAALRPDDLEGKRSIKLARFPGGATGDAELENVTR
jgi:hypothetical protein